MMPRTATLLPLAVRRALRQLGGDLHNARRRRRLTAGMVAERAHITRPTLRKVERGDPSVGMGTYATILWVLGLGERVGELATPATDTLGLSMADEDLPKRAHRARKIPHSPIERTEQQTAADPPPSLDSHQPATKRDSAGRSKSEGKAG